MILPIHFNLCVDATGVVCHQLGLLSTDLHAVGTVEALSRRSTNFAGSSPPAKQSMSSAEIGNCSAPNADSAFVIF